VGEGTAHMHKWGEAAASELLLIDVDLLLDRYRDYDLTRGPTAYSLATVALRGQREGLFTTMIDGLLWLDRQPEKLALLGQWWGRRKGQAPAVIDGVAVSAG